MGLFWLMKGFCSSYLKHRTVLVFGRRRYALKWLELVRTNVWKLCSKVSPFSWIRPLPVWCEACFMPLLPDIVGHFRTLWGHCRTLDNVVTDTLWERDWRGFWRLATCLSQLELYNFIEGPLCEECSKRTLCWTILSIFFIQQSSWPKQHHLWDFEFWQTIQDGDN